MFCPDQDPDPEVFALPEVDSRWEAFLRWVLHQVWTDGRTNRETAVPVFQIFNYAPFSHFVCFVHKNELARVHQSLSIYLLQGTQPVENRIDLERALSKLGHLPESLGNPGCEKKSLTAKKVLPIVNDRSSEGNK